MNSFKRLLLALALGMVIVPGLVAFDSKAIEGDWSMKVPDKKGGEEVFSIFTFHVNGNHLTGFMQGPGANPQRRITLTDGAINGAQFSFEFDENKITGTLLSDTTMELTFPGREEGPRHFKAIKTPGAFAALPVPPTAIHGVDWSKVGQYRALANLAHDAMMKGDMENAATLCTIMERFWDSERRVHDKSPDVWLQIDKAMDNFIGPIKGYQKKPPDQAKVQTVYQAYLEKLKLAE